MSRAFDLINRHKLVEFLAGFLDESSIRMIRALLSETYLSVRVRYKCSKPFESTSGTPQGDLLSPILFVIYLEAALRELKPYYKGNINVVAYADDVDFISSDRDALESLLEVMPNRLAEWFLNVNVEKTEFTELPKQKFKLDEHWRKVKKLRSLLGDEQDVTMRKTHANSALRSLKENWLKRKGLSTKTRIRLHNSLVKPILLYNAGTWGLSATDNDNLDFFHRDHLRRTLASKWIQG
ncbi:uncharacterized protein LOC115229770 [Octopus sinensis]|uniref:Uncharacterized protein LOC115229770 n=1 Tax=Octopus sinensis TaxID=2607531 RepID=A0A6P7TVV2_9MOLL|nr:uncharacterized protein LOC115229770 [Octopus sinensis]